MAARGSYNNSRGRDVGLDESPSRSGSEGYDGRRHERTSDRERRDSRYEVRKSTGDGHTRNDGMRVRSRSPYRASRRYGHDEYEKNDTKRRRRPSISPSFHHRRPDRSEDYARSRQRSSRSTSPYHRAVSDRQKPRRLASRSRSPSRSEGNHRRAGRRYGASLSPEHRREDSEDRHKQYKRRRSPADPPRDRRTRRGSPSPHSKRSKVPLPSQQAAFNSDTTVIKPNAPPEVEKQKPNYAPTGLLAAETNTVANTSIVLKYHEPPEARLPPPSAPWRLYIFKADSLLENLELYTRSCWLFGRERAVVDVPVEHPSASKQHAVIQFRYTEKRDEWGERKGGVKPYLIDLDSANGTKVNGERVESRRYVELRNKDVLGFGDSAREYVMLLPPKQ
ncbi:MAG: hypothetical protein Q9191_004189 [Dirinaria sp. TL-2023a]